MEIDDVRSERDIAKSLEKLKHLRVLDLADKYFGRTRVVADGREIVASSDSDIYVDCTIKNNRPVSGIVIHVGHSECTISVHDENLYDEASGFRRKYEQNFEGENVTLRHNLR